MIQNLDGLIEQYRSELFDSVLPFWLENSIDKEYGGYFTCLDREGKVFDTDKFIWLQGREVWMFAMLYNKVAPRKEWLDAAVKGAEFLKKHGHDGNYNFYFPPPARASLWSSLTISSPTPSPQWLSASWQRPPAARNTRK